MQPAIQANMRYLHPFSGTEHESNLLSYGNIHMRPYRMHAHMIRHDMETISPLVTLWEGNLSVTSGKRSSEISVCARQNKLLNKYSICRWRWFAPSELHVTLLKCVEVRKWISIFHRALYWTRYYFFTFGIWLTHVGKRGLCWPIHAHRTVSSLFQEMAICLFGYKL